MPSEATVKRGSRKNCSGSIGAATRRSQHDERDAEDRRGGEPAETSGSVQPRGVASMIA